MLFLPSAGLWHTSSVMVHCGVSMCFPQGTELRKEGRESGDELKLISCPLKTNVSFNHQLFPVLPRAATVSLWTLPAKPIRLDAVHDRFRLQSQSINVWLYQPSMAFPLLHDFYSVFKSHSIIPGTHWLWLPAISKSALIALNLHFQFQPLCYSVLESKLVHLPQALKDAASQGGPGPNCLSLSPAPPSLKVNPCNYNSPVLRWAMWKTGSLKAEDGSEADRMWKQGTACRAEIWLAVCRLVFLYFYEAAIDGWMDLMKPGQALRVFYKWDKVTLHPS